MESSVRHNYAPKASTKKIKPSVALDFCALYLYRQFMTLKWVECGQNRCYKGGQFGQNWNRTKIEDLGLSTPNLFRFSSTPLKTIPVLA
jgi:hypothetical protein